MDGFDVLARFSKNLRKVLSEKKISVCELARRMNVSRRILYRYLNGENFPKAERLSVICHSLNCDVGELFA